MKFIEITGSDIVGVQRDTAATIDAQGVRTPDRVDAASDKGAGALKAVQTLSMFEPQRVVVVSTPDKVSVAIARDLAELTHPGALIFTGEKALTPAVRKALTTLESRKYPLPKPNEAPSWVRARFSEKGVTPPGATLQGLAAIATDPTGAARIRHVSELLAACGLREPDQAVVEALTHDLGASEAFWVASDAVSRGDLARSRPSEDVEPVVALSMLARRLARIAAILEGEASSQELAGLMETSEAATRMMTKGVRASRDEVSRAYDVVIEAADLVRRVSDPVVARTVADTASLRAGQMLQGS